MALTISSPKNTMDQVVADTSWKAVLSGMSQGGFLYLNYTKGAESGLRVSLSVLCPEIDATNRFMQVKADSSFVLTQLYYDLTASGRYRIPVTFALGEKDLLVSYSATGGTLGGTLENEFREGA